jgi:hypothetical protein
MFKLGWTLKDKITGFEGTVVGRCEYISGCHQVLLVPKVNEKGEHRESHWFDESRCDRIGDSELVLNIGQNPGCDKAAPKI